MLKMVNNRGWGGGGGLGYLLVIVRPKYHREKGRDKVYEGMTLNTSNMSNQLHVSCHTDLYNELP